jgi:hypothetical protein
MPADPSARPYRVTNDPRPVRQPQRRAVAAMVRLGFTDITELDGGVVAWEAAGLALV